MLFSLQSLTQDILELSSSEKFSSSLRLSRINVDSSDSKSSKLSIPNLLAPKFPRPAMYSLNGYIPKPNIQRLSTTSSPLTLTKSPSSGRSTVRSHLFYTRNEFLNDKYSDKDNDKFNMKKVRNGVFQFDRFIIDDGIVKIGYKNESTFCFNESMINFIFT